MAPARTTFLYSSASSGIGFICIATDGNIPGLKRPRGVKNVAYKNASHLPTRYLEIAELQAAWPRADPDDLGALG
jgi:hypothetical protein